MPEFYMILVRKLSKYPNFYDICPKNLQNSRISHHLARQMPEFYVIIAREIFSRILGGTCSLPPPPVSYAYAKEYSLYQTRFIAKLGNSKGFNASVDVK